MRSNGKTDDKKSKRSSTTGGAARLAACMTNRILIENDDARITHAVTDVSQLNSFQYQATPPPGGLFIGGANNDYATRKTTFTKRYVLQCTGALDAVIPAFGGPSQIDGKNGQKVAYPTWNTSAYAYAQAYGYTGAAVAPVDGVPGVSSTIAPSGTAHSVCYLGGDVLAMNFLASGHGVVPGTPASDASLLAFLQRSSASANLCANGAAGGGGGGAGGGGAGNPSAATPSPGPATIASAAPGPQEAAVVASTAVAFAAAATLLL